MWFCLGMGLSNLCEVVPYHDDLWISARIDLLFINAHIHGGPLRRARKTCSMRDASLLI